MDLGCPGESVPAWAGRKEAGDRKLVVDTELSLGHVPATRNMGRNLQNRTHTKGFIHSMHLYQAPSLG